MFDDRDMKASPLDWLVVMWYVVITLKLADTGIVADWSWWIVLSPIWLGVILFAGVGVLYKIGERYYD